MKEYFGFISRNLFANSKKVTSNTELVANSVKHQQEHLLSYVEVAQPNSNLQIIFIHGSPGSNEGYRDYLIHPLLQKKASLIAIDRLGYGNSSDKVETSLLIQAQSIAPLLDNQKQTVLVGHSLGGPIALQLALLQPKKVDAVLMVAPALAPFLEKPKWYNWLASFPLIHWLLSTDLQHSNREMMPLEKELQLLSEQDWNTLTLPIKIIHGVDDIIADVGNSKYAIGKLPKGNTEMLWIEKHGHFVLWKEVDFVSREIVKLLRSVATEEPHQ